MQKRYYILLFLFAAFPVFAQISQEHGYKITFPENIASNAVFDVSLVASNPYNDANQLILYFNLSQKLSLRNLELRTFDNIISIPFRQINSYLESGKLYKAEIDLDENHIISKNYFQILSTLKSDNVKEAELKFSGILKADGKTAGYIQSSNDFTAEDTLKLSSVKLKFYKPQKFADNSVYFGPGAKLRITPDTKNVTNLLTEFWVRLNNSQTDFLKIINRQSGETLFDISTNPYQMITIKAQDQFKENMTNPYFLSRGDWYHIAVLSAFNDDSLSIYCSNKLIGKYSLPSFLSAADLEWKFENNSQNKSFQLDVLRFIDFNNSIGLSFTNKNYLNFTGKDIRVLYQFNFDNEDELYLAKDKMNISYQSVRFQRSDAPLFARAPELNINVLSNVYELIWSGGDYKQAKSYILEKSVNNADYQTVTSVDADNSDEKQYSLIDAKDPSAEVVYYRIEQVNKDGSKVYSSQVKIGQGKTDPFIVEQNYPNPFNPSTSIVVDLLEDTDVEVTVYNLEGKEIARLFKGYLSSGTHKFTFDASELSSGIYLYKVSTPNYSTTKKMIFTK